MEAEIATFDTHDFVKRLTSAGMTEAQAEIIAWGQSRRNAQLADKRDVKGLEAKISTVEAKVTALELAITRQEAAIKALEVNLTRDIREMEHKLAIKLGAFLVIGVTVLTLLDRLL